MLLPFLSPEDWAALRASRGYRTPFSLPIYSTRATNLAMFQLVLKHLEDGPKRILDIGCGSGALLQRISDHYREQGWEPKQYLLGADIEEESFQADVPFQTTDIAKPLNFQVSSFDIVIAMEVLEHIRSAYLLLDEIYATLNPGGKLLFSVPNIMIINSRLRFLFTGRFQNYPGPSSDPADSASGFGHINPLPIQYWDYGLRHSGFTDIRYQTDRMKKGGLCLSALLAPFLWLGKYLLHRQQRRYDPRVYQQNLRPFHEINSIRNLAGHSLMAVCTKPGNATSGK